jgi:hypothetical protein
MLSTGPEDGDIALKVAAVDELSVVGEERSNGLVWLAGLGNSLSKMLNPDVPALARDAE